jgi:nucleotide-binding universal stress UspA family protein
MSADVERAPRTLNAPKHGHLAAFSHLLVCLDGSAAAEGALPLASHVARLDRARVTLLRVLDAPGEPADGRATDAIAWEVAREHARAYVRRIAAELDEQGIAAEGRVAEGIPAHEVKSQATLAAADLIVLSTHGEGGDSAWDLGSTARKVLEIATSAVLVVPAHPRPVSHPSVPLRRIFVPLDGSLRGECALPTALRLARLAGAEIIVAHVVSEPIQSGVLYSEGDLAVAADLAERLTARGEAYLEGVRVRIADGGPACRKALIRATDHRAGLASLAASMEADLVVLTAHGSVCDTRRRFGSVTSYFLAHSTSPILVLQDLPDAQRSTAPSSRPPTRSVDAGKSG